MKAIDFTVLIIVFMSNDLGVISDFTSLYCHVLQTKNLAGRCNR